MRARCSPMPGAVDADAATESPQGRSEAVGLDRCYRALAPRLESVLRHELRGMLGAATLQMEVVRRFRQKGDRERVDGAIDRIGSGLGEVAFWNERRDRWLTSCDEPSATLGPAGETETLQDLSAFLRLFARRSGLGLELESEAEAARDELSGRQVDGPVRVALLGVCVDLMDALAASEAETGGEEAGGEARGAPRWPLTLSRVNGEPGRSDCSIRWPAGRVALSAEVRRGLETAYGGFVGLRWEGSDELSVSWPVRRTDRRTT